MTTSELQLATEKSLIISSFSFPNAKVFQPFGPTERSLRMFSAMGCRIFFQSMHHIHSNIVRLSSTPFSLFPPLPVAGRDPSAAPSFKKRRANSAPSPSFRQRGGPDTQFSLRDYYARRGAQVLVTRVSEECPAAASFSSHFCPAALSSSFTQPGWAAVLFRTPCFILAFRAVPMSPAHLRVAAGRRSEADETARAAPPNRSRAGGARPLLPAATVRRAIAFHFPGHFCSPAGRNAKRTAKHRRQMV